MTRQLCMCMLAAWYLVLTTGVSLHVHTCLGRISVVKIGAVPTADPCSCGVKSYGCCQDFSQTLQVAASHLGSTASSTDTGAESCLFSPAEVTPLVSVPQPVSWQAGLPDPPPGPLRYLLYHRLIYYG